MENIDAGKAQKLILGARSSKYGMYCPLYSFTTENIGGYYPDLPFPDANVLTVCASGDHIFNAVLLGAKAITCFDINKLTYYYFYLKRAAILSFSYSTFLSYFLLTIHGRENQKVFSYHQYQFLRKELPTDVVCFWDTLYRLNGYDGKKIRTGSLFHRRYDDDASLIRSNLYLRKEKYEVLQMLLRMITVSFIRSSLEELGKQLTERYNLILLSNIADACESIYPEEPLRGWKSCVDTLIPYLEKRGMIQFAYIYDFQKDKKRGHSVIDCYREVKKQFPRGKVRTFPSVLGDPWEDAIYYLREEC